MEYANAPPLGQDSGSKDTLIPSIAWEGVVGLCIDRCIIFKRNHMIHVRVFNIDLLTIEDLDTLLSVYTDPILISADVSKNVLSMHIAARVTV